MVNVWGSAAIEVVGASNFPVEAYFRESPSRVAGTCFASSSGDDACLAPLSRPNEDGFSTLRRGAEYVRLHVS